MKMLAMRRESDQFYGNTTGNSANNLNSGSGSNNGGATGYSGYQQQGVRFI